MKKIALYLAGGGARGAYQAGALKAISEILQTKKFPFTMLSGVSVGSINAAILAQHADDFLAGIKKIEKLWLNIHCDQVFNTSNYELGKSVVRNRPFREIDGSKFPPITRQSRRTHRAMPLEKTLEGNLSVEHLERSPPYDQGLREFRGTFTGLDDPRSDPVSRQFERRGKPHRACSADEDIPRFHGLTPFPA